jgi:p21-activated kinase 1
MMNGLNGFENKVDNSSVERHAKYSSTVAMQASMVTDIFKQEDPSAYYEVIKRMAKGSQGHVFKVKRLKDGKEFALKFMQPKSKEDYNNIKNEVAMMMICEKQDNILKCIDAYDHKERLWVFLEMMDVGALTEVIIGNEGKINEKVCAYILRKMLEGVKYLHELGIVHRDLKSDNILVNS